MESVNGHSFAKGAETPIVDFAGWAQGNQGTRQIIANQLIDACRKVGFVNIINHGVSSAQIHESFVWAKELFDLGREKKMLAPHPPGGAIHRGYSWPGFEKISQTFGDEEDPNLIKKLRSISDVKESYEIGSEQNPHQPNIWLPEEVLPGFRGFTTNFYWEMDKVAKMLLRAVAIGIGVEDEDFFLRFHSGNNNQLRLLHYPPILAADLMDHSKARMPAHTDWGTITLSFQDDCGGLQVENPRREGDFIDVPPLQDAIVMNVGDLLQRWSNDMFKSTLHRVTLPPRQDRFTGDERMTRARYSIPYFVAPEAETMVECLSQCTDDKHPSKYEPVQWHEYMLKRAGMSYE